VPATLPLRHVLLVRLGRRSVTKNTFRHSPAHED
jgi:hypothetical protein